MSTLEKSRLIPMTYQHQLQTPPLRTLGQSLCNNDHEQHNILKWQPTQCHQILSAQ
jgi:hypothetical protein